MAWIENECMVGKGEGWAHGPGALRGSIPEPRGLTANVNSRRVRGNWESNMQIVKLMPILLSFAVEQRGFISVYHIAFLIKLMTREIKALFKPFMSSPILVS